MSSDDFVEDPSGAASGYVQATVDCAHLDKVVTTDSFSSDLFTAKCQDCDNVQENWVCLNCYKTFCGRFAKRHMVKHKEATGHCVVVSLADLSCWCYECDQYLDHLSIRPIFEIYRALHVIKFNKQTVAKFQGEASEEEKSESQKDTRDAETMKAILAQQQQQQQQRPQSGAAPSSSQPLPPVDEGPESEDEQEEAEEAADADSGGGQKFLEMMAKLMKAETGATDEDAAEEKAEGPLKAADLASFAEAIKSGKIKRVVVMAGAGISVSAGIPDFRSPKTGLYANLAKYNLPHPEAVFEIDYFRSNPKPFCTLAKELYPGSFNPTPAHFFIKLLADKGLLVRCYTQNIDGLEFHAGLATEQVIQAHGGFQTAHCLSCRELYPEKYCKDFIFRDEVPKCAKCEGLVKPDIVFFGESLPARFHSSVPVDFPAADALIVMGTSLKVQPFASLADRVPASAARLLINLEKVGCATSMGFLERLLMGTRGFEFDSPTNRRDVFLQDNTDSGVRALADALGWREELDKLIAGGSKPTDSKL